MVLECTHPKERIRAVVRSKFESPVPPGTALREGGVPVPARDLPWRILWLLSIYRVLVPIMLLLVQWLATLVPTRPSLFLQACLLYLGAAMLLFVAQQQQRFSLRLLALVNACVDSVGLALILYASGGVASGLGSLLVLPVMGAAILAGSREGALLSTIAIVCLLVQQVLVELATGLHAADSTAAAALGCVLLAIALSASPIANRLRESEALLRRQRVDLDNLAQLSQYIVKHLRESILVIDAQDRIRLINESASQLLGADPARQGGLVQEVSPKLQNLLSQWRLAVAAGQSPVCADPTFAAADGSRILRADFVALPATAPAPASVIVFLEETGLLELRAQQSRLAALARLSASIAHEVKNPVHAMSAAAQLLAESPGLAEEDRRLTQIVRTNSDRVSRIIDSVLKLSRGERTQLVHLSLQSWTEEFRQEFCDTMQWPPSRLQVQGSRSALEVRADPGQLRQIVWNLCENAWRHATQESREQPVELVYGRLTPSARPFLEVRDRGPGVAPEHVERIFEPFFSQGAGTGMGLYLARELAQTNGATLLYLPRKGGGSTFRIIFSDPLRWEARGA